MFLHHGDIHLLLHIAIVILELKLQWQEAYLQIDSSNWKEAPITLNMDLWVLL